MVPGSMRAALVRARYGSDYHLLVSRGRAVKTEEGMIDFAEISGCGAAW
jgi:hypothetical protein